MRDMTMASDVVDLSVEELFRAHYTRVHRLLFRLTGDRGASEDLATEVFVKLLKYPPGPRQSIEGWLSRSAVWLGLEYIRKRSRRQRLSAIANVPGSGSANPDDLLHVKQLQARVRLVLASLKPEQAQLLLLRNEGMTYAEIAETLGRNVTTVGTLLVRAEDAFRKEYTKAYGRPEA